ncbi:RluA family pseudouridine synthase [Deinococcus radiophilus]|uniref:RluA family pseudouridine synthase n=1 Tax=Deinococcus radiophilus TaxID=32062 RepID=A0A431VV90_9DEIO|nr:RluA family pseudouridine synthase [Deinococcus radiophilus]RTR27080.1 RluA family pseudouridine synthase [Deinococcus radiophilus]UFA50137.1 RluA family pseudouridine synthase [Deinococcus radiophilus]
MTLNNGHCYRERVGTQGAGLSVLDYYTRFYAHSDQATWAARLAGGEVTLNGQAAHGAEQLQAGDALAWQRPPWQEEAVPLHYDVLFQDAALLAVHKPPGLPTLPAGGFLDHTLLTLLRRDHPTATPLHRLGRGTSGVVLCGLTRPVTAQLSADWRSGRIHKRYRALSAGVAPQDRYDLRTPVGPVAHPKLGQVYAAAPDGKPSRSRARVLERRAESTLFEVDIDTGRPHQIRIHLAAAGFPLLDDPLYLPGGAARPEAVPSDLGYLLHAERLSLTHPLTGEDWSVSAPVPAALDVGQ